MHGKLARLSSGVHPEVYSLDVADISTQGKGNDQAISSHILL
jgi:hypothetical protein